MSKKAIVVFKCKRCGREFSEEHKTVEAHNYFSGVNTKLDDHTDGIGYVCEPIGIKYLEDKDGSK